MKTIISTLVSLRQLRWQLIVAIFAFFPALAGAQGPMVSFENPLAFDNLNDLILAILNALIVLAIPIIVFFIIYAGFLYVTAQGNPEKIKEATRTLTYAVIGAVIILGATAIAEIVANTVEEFSA